MSGGFHRLNSHVTEFDHVAILQSGMIKFRAGSFAQTDAGSGLISQFDVTRQEVGMEVSQEDILDRVSTSLRIGQILFNITLRIHDSGDFCFLIRNHVRRMSQTAKIILLEEHV